MFKKSALMLAIVLSLLLASLGSLATPSLASGPAQDETAPTPQPYQPWEPTKTFFDQNITLSAAMIDEEREWLFRDLLPEFEKKTGVKVVIDMYGFAELYNKNLTASAGKTGEYDIYQMHFPDMALFDERGYFVDLTDWVMRDAKDPSFMLDDIEPYLQGSHMKYKDRYYGVPTHVGANFFYYRKDILEKEGLEVPTNWEKTLEVAKSITEKYAPEMYGFTFMGRGDIQGMATFMGFMGAYGCDFYDHTTFKPTINAPECVKALETYVSMLPYSVPESASFGFDENHMAFQKGKAAMIVFWDSGDGFFSDPKQSDIVGKWGVGVVPGGHGANGGWSVQISTGSQYPEAAWEFLKWLVSPEMENRAVPLKPSCRISVLTDPAYAQYPGYMAFHRLLNEGKPFDFPKILPNWQMMEMTAQRIQEVLTGQKQPKEALDGIQQEIEIMFLRYGLWQP